jgi:hypothetical protein
MIPTTVYQRMRSTGHWKVTSKYTRMIPKHNQKSHPSDLTLERWNLCIERYLNRQTRSPETVD